MKIYLVKNYLYIKTNENIHESDLQNLIKKTTSIISSYKLRNLVIDIQDKKLEKKFLSQIKKYNDLYDIKKKIL